MGWAVVNGALLGHFTLTYTMWKVSRYETFSGPYFLVFSPNMGKYGPEKTLISEKFYALLENHF